MNQKWEVLTQKSVLSMKKGVKIGLPVNSGVKKPIRNPFGQVRALQE